MPKPIYDTLKKLNNDKMYPFCMPGHKRNTDFLDDNLLKLDFTEVDETDNLHNPKGVIKQAQALMARACGADECFFCVNGSSGALQAAVMSVCSDGEKILVADNCHKSVFNGLILSGAFPVYMSTQAVSFTAGGINPQRVEEGIKKYPDIKAVIITSPTYEGLVPDIKSIADIVHKYNKILIADSAHGAHFHFNDYFPKDAYSLGADIAVESWHKTMPVPNQCCILLCRKKYRKSIAKCLSIMQTTSPSYIFMSLMDKYRDIFENNKEPFDAYVKRLKTLRIKLKSLKNIKLFDKELINSPYITDIDNGKIILYSDKMSGNTLGNILHDKYKIQCEAQYESHIIIMTSVADTRESFENLYRAVEEIDKNEEFYERKADIYFKEDYCFYSPAVPPRKAFFSEKETIKISESSGRISACFITPYPPGIPVIRPGDIIDKKILKLSEADEIEVLKETEKK